MLVLYLKATNHNSLHYIDFEYMQRYKAVKNVHLKLLNSVNWRRFGNNPFISQDVSAFLPRLPQSATHRLYLFAKIYVFGNMCSSKLTIFLELCSKKTVCFLEMILSVDKYFHQSA